MNHDKRYIWLDLVRGLCALAVFLGHLRSVVIQEFANFQGTPNLFQISFYFLTGFGHQAVVVFFVLSGFFVGGSVIQSGKNFSWNKYAISRLSRLWIVLIPSLFFTFFIDSIISTTNPDVLQGEYQELWHSGPKNSGYSNGISTFIGNLFFLQTILVPIYGTNGPLWSLANEFWYYLLFPLFTIGLTPWGLEIKSSWLPRSISIIGAITIFFILPIGIREGFFIWLMGIIVFFFKGKLKKPQTIVLFLIGLILFFGSLIYSRKNQSDPFFGIPIDNFIGLSFCLLCISLVNFTNNPKQNNIFFRSINFISDSSYSLYLFHFPLVILIGSFVYPKNQMQLNLLGVFHFVFWSLSISLICFLFYLLFEKQTYLLRNWMSNLLGQKKPK